MNPILQTGNLLPQSIVANGLTTGVGWKNPNYLLQASTTYIAESNPSGASDVTLGNYNFALPQNAVITGIQLTLIAQSNGSPQTNPPLTLNLNAYDDTGSVPLTYPMNPPFTSFTPTLTQYILGGQNYLFNTSWTVNQINNFKLNLIANGDMLVSTVLVNVFYYLVPSLPSPAPVGPPCLTCNSPVQAPFFTTAQPILPGDTSMTLNSFTFANGIDIPMSVLGDCGGWLSMTIDPGLRIGSDGTGNFEENVIVTSWSTLPTGQVVLNFGTLTNRGITPFEPYTHNTAYVSGHGSGAKVILSDDAEFMDRFVRACQVGIVYSAPIVTESNGAVITDPTVIFNFKNGFSVTQNLSNPEQSDIVALGASVTPPQLVGVGSGTSGNVQVGSLTYTLPVSGVNRAAVIQVSTQEAVTISSVTVGGVSCTRESTSTDVGSDLRQEQWVCVAPPVGIENVVITLSGNAYVSSGGEAWINVDQAGAVGATQNATNSSVNPSLVITTTKDNSILVDGLATAQTPILYTPGAGQAASWTETSNGDTRQGGSSYAQSGTHPDAVTMQYNITQNTTWCYTAIELLGLSAPSFTGVQSVTGYWVDNTDPLNPIITVPKSNFTAVVAPTVGNDNTQGYSIGSQWFDSITNTLYIAQSVATGAAVWDVAGSGTSGITEINGDTTPHQVIQGAGGITVSSSAGVTTVAGGGSSGVNGILTQTFLYTDFSHISSDMVATFSGALPSGAVPIGATFNITAAFDSGTTMEVEDVQGGTVIAAAVASDSIAELVGQPVSDATFNFASTPNPVVVIPGVSSLTTGSVTVTIIYGTGGSKFGGTGVDGTLIASSGTTTIDLAGARIKTLNYSEVSLTGTAKLAFINPHANGSIVYLKSQGNITATAAAPIINCSGLGAAGGTGGTNATLPSGTFIGGTDGTSGISYGVMQTNFGVASTSHFATGAGGAVGSLTTAGWSIGLIEMIGKYPQLFVGAGGAGGSGFNEIDSGAPTGNVAAGAGGRGGGCLIIECGGSMNFTTANGITVAGANGGNGTASGGGALNGCEASGGSGGGGGSAFIFYNSLTAFSGTVAVTGGSGGTGQTTHGSTVAGGGGGGSATNPGVSGGSSNSGVAGGNGLSIHAFNTEY